MGLTRAERGCTFSVVIMPQRIVVADLMLAPLKHWRLQARTALLARMDFPFTWTFWPQHVGTAGVIRRAPASGIASAKRKSSTIIGLGWVVWTRTTCSP